VNITVNPADDVSDGDDGDDGSDGDADGDGVPDSEEGDGDLDGDGTPNDEDTDTDGDGIPDAEEGTGDVDGDGTPNYLDPDEGDAGAGDDESDGSEAGTTDPGENDDREDCELFGISYGSFIICWYWWLLIPIVGLSLVVYQTWHRGMLRQLLGMKNDDIGGETDE